MLRATFIDALEEVLPGHTLGVARVQLRRSAFGLGRPQLFYFGLVEGLRVETCEQARGEQHSVLGWKSQCLLQERLGCIGHVAIVPRARATGSPMPTPRHPVPAGPKTASCSPTPDTLVGDGTSMAQDSGKLGVAVGTSGQPETLSDLDRCP